MQAVEIARRAAEIAGDKLARNIVVMDARQVCNFADYFVLCTTESDRQTKAVYDEIENSLKQEGARPHHHEGTVASGWLLLDYGDAIVHVFSAAERDYYALDNVWADADIILQMQ